jgi:nitroimidazol reductase NimA-like FMN-containing flavoprotein (pyridoxamine 5'-phosphate oxidase superfamily)
VAKLIVHRAGGERGLHPSLETLSQDECRAHLSAGGVGRIVFSTATGPVALPVNFVSPNADVIFRTVESVATAVELEETVSFEVDRIDDAMSEGWSVLATGNPYRVENPQERHELEILDVEPWAGGVRNVFMWIATETLSGRVIVQQADPEPEPSPGE